MSAPAYVAGSVLGGLVVGAAAGGLGAIVLGLVDIGATARLVLLALALLLALLLDLRAGGRRVPGPRRQVNEDWLEVYREWVYGAGFGLQLGAAVLTQVATAATWAMLLAAALTGSVAAGALIGVVFGAVRSLPIALTRDVRDAASLRRLHQRAAAWERPASVTTVGTLGVAAAVVTGLAATGGSL